ncbi:MAG: type II toxin-antitoxin system death-on-curing family toxin [Alphaproteobacteria bacterium]|nr:type II toxin-antitoxin system death-on-curing family toxin [Alphaproteobacteria bacterium]
MSEPLWLSLDLVLAVHKMVLAEHGGADGVRDQGLLESALDRPKNRFAYETADIVSLAASYAYGLAKNHPFIDGNKRIAFMAAAIFLETNGFLLTASEAEATIAVLSLASSAWSETEFEAWLSNNTKAPAP